MEKFVISNSQLKQQRARECLYYHHRGCLVHERWVWAGILTGGRGSSLKDSESMGLKKKTNKIVWGIFSFPAIC